MLINTGLRVSETTHNNNKVLIITEFLGIVSYPGMKCSQGRIAYYKRFTGIQIALT